MAQYIDVSEGLSNGVTLAKTSSNFLISFLTCQVDYNTWQSSTYRMRDMAELLSDSNASELLFA